MTDHLRDERSGTGPAIAPHERSLARDSRPGADTSGVAEQFGVVARIAALFREAREADGLPMPLRAGGVTTLFGFGAEVEPTDTTPASDAEALFEFGALRVIERVGEGAYGEVYRAWDQTLQREVALKLLKPEVAQSPGAIQAAVKEGQLLARIRNPNVMAIHGALQSDGRVGFWGEFLRGRTLAKIVETDGPLSAEECVVVGESLCQALAAVHRAGVLHRDIKAQNVMRAVGGRFVLTDFGIGLDVERARTRATALAGTPLYLAPELFNGGRPSVQSDIYAVGVLLFYLSTGNFPVGGATFDEIARAHADGRRVRLRDARPDLPASFVDAVEGALAPRVEERCSSIGALQAALRPGRVADPARLTEGVAWKRWAMMGAMSTGVFALALAVTAGRPRPEPPRFGDQPLHFTISTPPNVALTAGSRNVASVSPDGMRIAFVGTDEQGVSRVWVRDLGSTAARALAGSEGAEKPVWSPDGRAVLFVSADRLMRLNVGESVATKLAEMASGGGASWAGNIVMFVPAPRSGVHVVPAAGGAAQQITTVDRARGEAQHLFPHLHADATHFLYYVTSADAAVRGVYFASLDGISPRRVVDSIASAVFAGDDVMYLRDGVLVAHRIDLATGQLLGQPVTVAQNVGATWTGQGAFSASPMGVLAFASTHTRDTRKLVWYDAQGRQLGLVDEGDRFRNPALSPDERALAIERYRDAAVELRVYDLARGGWTRVGEAGDRSRDPVWSGDSRMIAYVSDRDGYETVYASDPQSREPARTIWRSDTIKMPTDWTPDNKWIAVVERGERGDYDAWLLASDGSGRKQPLATTSFNEVNVRFSRDGQWVTYVSNESGRYEAYVERFPSTGRRRMASTGGAVDPAWADAGELVFIDPRGRLMRVAVPTDERQPISAPELMFVTPIDTPGSSRNHFAVTRSATRVLLNVPFVDRSNDTIDILVNWRQSVQGNMTGR